MRDLKRTQRALGTPPVTATTPKPAAAVKVTFELQHPKKALEMMIEVCSSSLAKAAKPICAAERLVVELMEHSDTNTVVPVPVIFDKELLLVEVVVVDAKPMTATQSPPVILHLDVDAYVVVFFAVMDDIFVLDDAKDAKPMTATQSPPETLHPHPDKNVVVFVAVIAEEE